jgi:hypothetical protein
MTMQVDGVKARWSISARRDARALSESQHQKRDKKMAGD